MRLSRKSTTWRCRHLNSLVTELLNARVDLPQAGTAEHSFENPRHGWVFVTITPKRKVGFSVSLGESAIIKHPGATEQRAEAMRLLPAGEHKLVLRTVAPASGQLIVRAIPHLGFCKYGYDPRVTPYGPFDWAYIEKHVAPHVNYLVGGTAEAHGPIMKKWRERGKLWLIECGVPGLVNAPN